MHIVVLAIVVVNGVLITLRSVEESKNKCAVLNLCFHTHVSGLWCLVSRSSLDVFSFNFHVDTHVVCDVTERKHI